MTGVVMDGGGNAPLTSSSAVGCRSLGSRKVLDTDGVGLGQSQPAILQSTPKQHGWDALFEYWEPEEFDGRHSGPSWCGEKAVECRNSGDVPTPINLPSAATRIMEVLDGIAHRQERLGAEFEAAIFDDLEELYEE